MFLHAASQTVVSEYILLLRPGFRLSDLVRTLEWMNARKSITESPINWTLCSMDGGLVRDCDGMLVMAPGVLKKCLFEESLLLVMSGEDDYRCDYELNCLLQQRRKRPLIWMGGDHLLSDYFLFRELNCRQCLDEIMTRLFMSDLTVDQGDCLLEELEVPPAVLGLCDSRVQRALAVMRRYIDQPLNRELVAREACLSLRQLERLFQKHFEMTPGRYFTRMKMDFAHRCLQNNQQNVSDIAYCLGFNSVSHFCKVYKSRFGIAPGSTPVIV
ncbi:MAG: hypothetical protein CMI09_05375 [Oceanospirillaceae bacterium]|nr:hypothetical protein [Oceanospirillaceae bacterium]